MGPSFLKIANSRSSWLLPCKCKLHVTGDHAGRFRVDIHTQMANSGSVWYSLPAKKNSNQTENAKPAILFQHLSKQTAHDRTCNEATTTSGFSINKKLHSYNCKIHTTGHWPLATTSHRPLAASHRQPVTSSQLLAATCH